MPLPQIPLLEFPPTAIKPSLLCPAPPCLYVLPFPSMQSYNRKKPMSILHLSVFFPPCNHHSLPLRLLPSPLLLHACSLLPFFRRRTCTHTQPIYKSFDFSSIHLICILCMLRVSFILPVRPFLLFLFTFIC